MPPDRAADALAVERLSVHFAAGRGRRIAALAELDLRAGPGEIVAVLGPNGSGKTTLFRVLCGEVRPSGGRVEVLGSRPGAPALVARVGYQPDGPLPFPQASARELLVHLGGLLGLARAARRARAAALLEQVGLGAVAERRVAALSTGMQRRLALAAALVSDPEVLLLDEPTAGLDPLGSRIVLDLLREARQAGRTVLMASHHLDEVEAIADRALLLHRGRRAAEGDLDDLLGGDSELLELAGLGPATRAPIEAAARAAGAEVRGWSRRRRHPFELFRELDARAPAGPERGEPR